MAGEGRKVCGGEVGRDGREVEDGRGGEDQGGKGDSTHTYSSIMKNDSTAVPKIRKQPLYY